MTLSQQVQQLETAHTQAVAAVADLTGQVADLRARLAALRPPILWGAAVWRFGTETYRQALARAETTLGKFGIVRYFCPAAPAWPADTGDRLLHISFRWLPADVLAGKHDAEFRTWCAAAPDRPTWWSFWHEAEKHVAAGRFTAADHRAAWRRLAGIAKASGKDLRATLTLMGWTLEPVSKRNWRDYYPGPDVIDVLAWNCYLGYTHTDPAKVYADARRVSAAEGKPWAVAETAVDKVANPDPAKRAALLTALARDLATVEPQPSWVAYFDADRPDEPQAWDISREPPMAAAWIAGSRGLARPVR